MEENQSANKEADSLKKEPSVEAKKNPKKELEKMLGIYLANKPVMTVDGKVSELEIRFGTNTKLSRPITKIDYDNVVKQLYASGFTTPNKAGIHMLRIQNEYTDPRTGLTKMSNIRTEIVGINLIQEYCKSNSLQKILNHVSNDQALTKVKFTQKQTPLDNDNNLLKPVDFEDFNFRVSYQYEKDYNTMSNTAKNIISKWSDSKKTFRHINRVRFEHPTLPLFADISIIKKNKNVKGSKVPIPQYTIQDAGVMENIETYEVELEIDNKRVGIYTNYDTTEKLTDAIRKGVRIILTALQGTNYPITYAERKQIQHQYMKLLHGDDYEVSRVLSRDFIGPSSYTLQLENIIEQQEDTNIPNIRKNYTVTDKADGERKLLYISDNGRIYMIDTNMNVIFTGTMTAEKTLYNSLLDGEHIRYDKTGKNINLYAAFDIYYVNKTSVRELAFMKISGEEEELDNKYRLLLLKKSMTLIKPHSVLEGQMKRDENKGIVTENTIACNFVIKCKEFYMGTENYSIFQGCSTILSNIRDGIYEYNTDGLIFTPCHTGVNSRRVGESGPLYKNTWDMSFKWKPAEFNTIDFLVSIRKDKNGKDEIHNIFQNGVKMTGIQNVVQYKTLVLRCGFNEKKHGFLNPFQDILDDNIPSVEDIDNEETYKPVPFQPTTPFDPKACFCNILLKEDGNGNLLMQTEEGEYFEEDMIVEFKYVMENEEEWKWVPLRVRYDKTAELRAGMKNYGNAYHVANSNWHSIHNPITEEMISTGVNLPEYIIDEDVYYNRSGIDSSTKALRNFHNLYVKKKLIVGVSERKHTLIDYAVGKAGDLSKWIEGKLGFVFGVDVSRDNIHNNLDGACARYLKDRKKFHTMPSALFINGNSSSNIRNGEAFTTDKDKMIARAVFGNGPKDRKLLGEGVYKHYGKAHEGFNISSCQFALHYFFENHKTFHGFLKNVAECTAMGGHFIGTCYDGKEVFKLLKNKYEGESITIMKDQRKIYEITKMYNQTGFSDDETSLGYSINVYQETINKTFREYLVNFDYLIRIMEDYGFILITPEEANKMDLPAPTGLFSILYKYMNNEIQRNPRKRSDYGDAPLMSEEEKQISFMNRYFVFKKVRTVNTNKLADILMKYDNIIQQTEEEYEDNHDATQYSRKMLNLEEKEEKEVEAEAKPKGKARKLTKKKLIIENYSPIVESPEEEPKPKKPEPVMPKNKVIFGEQVKFIKKIKPIVIAK